MNAPPIVVAGSRNLDFPHEAVFEALFIPAAQLEWNSIYLTLEVDPPGRPRDGTVVRGTFKGAGRATMHFEEVAEGRSFVHRSRLLMFERLDLGDFGHRFDVHRVGASTRVTQTVTLKPTRLGRLVAPLLRSSFARRLPDSFDELAAYLTPAHSSETTS